MAAVAGAIGIGTSILGGLTGAASASEQSQAQQATYNYQAGVATINAQIAKQNQEYAVQQGEQEAQTAGMQGAQQMGKIKVAQASSGLDINSGSAKQVQNSQQLVTDLNLDQIRSNAAKTAYDYDVQATQYTNQATLYKMGAANAAAAEPYNVASSILGSASSVSSKWLQGQSVGMFGTSSGDNGSVASDYYDV